MPAKRPTKKAAVKEQERFAPDDLRESVKFLMTIPDIAEAFTPAEIELAIDDIGWERPWGSRLTQTEADPLTRMSNIGRARLYWRRDPLCHQAVRVWTDYAIGQGFSWKAKESKIQQTLDAFAKDRRNKHIMNAVGQQRSSKKLLVDGELFFAVFNSDGGDKIIRYIDPLQMTEFICDPDDEETVLAYERKTVKGEYFFYADWAAEDDGKAAEEQKAKDSGKNVVLEDDVKIYHLAFDTIGKRGNSLLAPVLDWSREHRRFAEARVAIMQALSKYAWKTTVKGGQNVINAIKTRLQSTYAATGTSMGVERNPTTAPGGNWLQNAGIDVTPMPRNTGGSDAKEDADGLKLMVSAGTGVMLHYFGDPTKGNLATASAMELPMLKEFGGYQELWREAYRDIFAVVLDEDPDEEPTHIDVAAPEIVVGDLMHIGQYIAVLAQNFPEVKVPSMLQELLQILGVGDIASLMDEIKAQKAVNDAKAATLPTVPPAIPPKPGEPPIPPLKAQPNTEAALVESLNKLIKLMEPLPPTAISA